MVSCWVQYSWYHCNQQTDTYHSEPSSPSPLTRGQFLSLPSPPSSALTDVCLPAPPSDYRKYCWSQQALDTTIMRSQPPSPPSLCRLLKLLKRPKSPHFSAWSHFKDTNCRSKKPVLFFFRVCSLVQN